MDLRLALLDLAHEHRLDAAASQRLEALAEFRAEPAGLQRWLPIGMAALAAALIGLGLVFWVAANWESLGRFGRFALLQATVLAMGAGAVWRPAWRAPLSLLVLLAAGGLFAYFGQTYQTGADPWQLFALWAALTLPLALAVRSDIVWAPWVLVVVVGIALWIQAHIGHRWQVQPEDLAVHLTGWAVALVTVIAIGPLGRTFSGAGDWSLRTAVTLAVAVITATAIGGLFSRSVGTHYVFGLIVLAVVALAFVPRRSFDVFALSAAALGLNTLLVAGLARLLLENAGGDPIGRVFLLGAAAAGLLAASVTAILRLARRQAGGEAAA